MTAFYILLILTCVGVPLLFACLLGYSLLVVAAQCDDREGTR